MTSLDFLERLAREASASHGMSIGEARRLVRLAMVTVAVEMQISSERIVAYIQSVGTPSDAATS